MEKDSVLNDFLLKFSVVSNKQVHLLPPANPDLPTGLQQQLI